MSVSVHSLTYLFFTTNVRSLIVNKPTITLIASIVCWIQRLFSKNDGKSFLKKNNSNLGLWWRFKWFFFCYFSGLWTRFTSFGGENNIMQFYQGCSLYLQNIMKIISKQSMLNLIREMMSQEKKRVQEKKWAFENSIKNNDDKS